MVNASEHQRQQFGIRHLSVDRDHQQVRKCLLGPGEEAATQVKEGQLDWQDLC